MDVRRVDREIMETKRGVVVYQMDTVNSTGMAITGEVVKQRVVTLDIIFLETIVYTMDTDETMEWGKRDLVIFPMDMDVKPTTDIVGLHAR